MTKSNKNPKWKSFIKGEYDLHKERFSFLVTGSARLNAYKRSGDSLLGRYHYYRLHPFSYAEILKIKNIFHPGKGLRFPNRKHDKEPKLYLWDWSEIEDESRRLENMVASHILKFCNYLYDVHGHKVELFYLRDVDKREVDFLDTHKGKPWFAVEVKMSDVNVSTALNYFRTRLDVPFSFQVVKNTQRDFWAGDVRVIPLAAFLSGLV